MLHTCPRVFACLVYGSRAVKRAILELEEAIGRYEDTYDTKDTNDVLKKTKRLSQRRLSFETSRLSIAETTQVSLGVFAIFVHELTKQAAG